MAGSVCSNMVLQRAAEGAMIPRVSAKKSSEENNPEAQGDAPAPRRRGRPKRMIPTRAVCFRCPPHVLMRLDELCVRLGRSRTSLIIAATKMLCREVRAHGGYLMPGYSHKVDFERKDIDFAGVDSFEAEIEGDYKANEEHRE